MTLPRMPKHIHYLVCPKCLRWQCLMGWLRDEQTGEPTEFVRGRLRSRILCGDNQPYSYVKRTTYEYCEKVHPNSKIDPMQRFQKVSGEIRLKCWLCYDQIHDQVRRENMSTSWNATSMEQIRYCIQKARMLTPYMDEEVREYDRDVHRMINNGMLNSWHNARQHLDLAE